MSDEGLTYDLATLAAAAYSWRRSFRRIVGAALVAFVLLLGASLAYNFFDGTFIKNLEATYAAAYVGLTVGIFICAWAVWLLGRGATSIVIAPDALIFQYPSGKVDRLVWSDPEFKLNLWDWTASSSILPAAALHEASIWNRPRTQLTVPAYDAIVQAAQSRGLSVTVKPARASIYGSPGQILLLRSRASK